MGKSICVVNMPIRFHFDWIRFKKHVKHDRQLGGNEKENNTHTHTRTVRTIITVQPKEEEEKEY